MTVAGVSTLVISSLAMLIVGIIIGYAAKKRLDRASRGIT
jgi:HAMP domain-containing protein